MTEAPETREGRDTPEAQLGESPTATPTETAPASASSPIVTVTAGGVAWVCATALFVLLRFGPVLQAPVGGAELVHLSGAWQARIGQDDSRFVPTLFQALASLLLRLSDSAVPARALAFAATATIPAALWLLRRQLGNAAALATLLLLALDGPAIALGSTASAMGFDAALAVWLFVALTRERTLPPWAWGAGAFFVATAGPLPLTVVIAWAVVSLAKAGRPGLQHAAWAAGGVVAGMLVASLGFGHGWQGLTVPPFDLFSASFDGGWSSTTAGDAVLLYAWPVLLPAVAALLARMWELWSGETASRIELLSFAWAGVALAWLVAAWTADSTVATAAATMALAFVLGPALARIVPAMLRADWRLAKYLVPAIVFALVLAVAVFADWARAGRYGSAEDTLKVSLLLGGAAIAATGLLLDRRAAPSLVAVAVGIFTVPLLAGALGVALSGASEPLPSPIAPEQARALRDLALARANDRGGAIVVHADLADAMTWPFRDSGDLILATRVPDQATVVIWPLALPAPQGFTRVEGTWTLRRTISTPTADVLDWFHWYIDRNRLKESTGDVAMYVRTGP